jgi:uncharacterized protein
MPVTHGVAGSSPVRTAKERITEKFYEKYAATQTQTIRDFIHTIDWSNRFIGIKGSRGVGKTTLILQYIKQNYKPNHTVLYITLDNLYFQRKQTVSSSR